MDVEESRHLTQSFRLGAPIQSEKSTHFRSLESSHRAQDPPVSRLRL